MPGKRSRTPNELTEGQAMFVLTRLVEDRRISQTEVGRYVKEMEEEISALEDRLRRLRQAQSGAPNGATRHRRAASDVAPGDESVSTRRGKRRRRRRQHLTPERIATLKLQGQYLAMMRKLSQRQRAQYKKQFREQGLEATVKAMHSANAQ